MPSRAKSTREKAVIYYAMAVFQFLEERTEEHLVGDVLNHYHIKMNDFDLAGTQLLSDPGILAQAINLLETHGIINVEHDEYAPQIISFENDLEDEIEDFEKNDRDVIER